MIYNVYRVKLKSMGNAITVVGIGYVVEPSTGMLRVYDRHRHGGEWQKNEIFTSSHGSWEWIRKIDERDE